MTNLFIVVGVGLVAASIEFLFVLVITKMAVNLLKNKETMQQAWKDIIDDNKPTNWAVYSYEGKTFDLKLHSSGDGGLEEMVEEFSSGKIMYSVCKVNDPKTSLPKYVLINWQGEGAPGDRKGKCANHIRDIGDFFKGVHITINARTEDDVDPNIVIDKVSRATGSVYSFKDRTEPAENHNPVGSVYKRIVPKAEINSRERDKFWEKQELEEKLRIEEERKKCEEASANLETERHKREIQDAQRRDGFVKQRIKSISEMREAEKVASKSKVEIEKQRWQKQMEEDAKENEKRLKTNENRRLERNHEVESLIGQRTLNARAIFEQNTVMGQMSAMKSTVSTNQINNSINTTSRNNSQLTSQDSDSSSYSTSSAAGCEKLISPDRTPPSPEPELASACSNKVVSNVDTSQYSATCVVLGEEPESDNHRVEEHETPMANADQPVAKMAADADVVAQYAYTHDGQDQDNGTNLMVRALYDYQAADDTEISFNPDDIITHVDRIDEGWWQGLSPDGTYGLFPANYVEIVE